VFGDSDSKRYDLHWQAPIASVSGTCRSEI